jgi:guanylate kinase
MTQPDRLLLFAAPSGSGKTTIARHLLRCFPSELAFSISATTRPPRGTEQDGVDYHFLAPEEFDRHVSAGDFLEYEEVYRGMFYGTLRSEIQRIWSTGRYPVLDMDVEGALNLKRQLGERVYAVFVQPPSPAVLAERLRARGTDSEQKVRERLAKAQAELLYAPDFDCVLVNDELTAACQQAEQLWQQFRDA